MKKNILTFISILLFSINSFSQIDSYGLKIGIQSTGVYSNLYSMNRFYGLSLYGFADIKITEDFFSTIDLGFTQRGFKNTMDERNDYGEFVQEVIATSKLTYISFTPSINFNTQIASSTIYLAAGPRFDFLIDRVPGKFKFTAVTITDELVNYLDKYVFGVSIIGGIKNIRFGGTSFRLEGKYEVDITDSMSKYPAKFRSNVFMLAFGINL